MAREDDDIAKLTKAPAFNREFKRRSKHSSSKYLPNNDRFRVLQMCTMAAGDEYRGREWFETKPLADIYEMLAVRLANIDDT